MRRPQDPPQLRALQQEAARLAAELASADIRARRTRQEHEAELRELAAANAGLQAQLQQALQRPAAQADAAALLVRVQQLEASNERLELALGARPSLQQQGAASELAQQQQHQLLQGELFRLRDAGREKDRVVASLVADLALARSAAASAKGRPASEAHAAQLELLRQELAGAERRARSAQERLVASEAAQALAQQAAARAQQELQGLRQELPRAQQEARRLAGDADIARQTATRLNARVSELALAEQVARSEAGSAREQQGARQEQHQLELQELQGQVEHLHEQLERFVGDGGGPLPPPQRYASPSRLSLHAPAADISPARRPASAAGRVLPSPSAARLVEEREQMLRGQVEETEAAVAVMQSKLMESERRRLQADKRLQQLAEEQQEERVELQQQVGGSGWLQVLRLLQVMRWLQRSPCICICEA
jgi:hypothetical protein